MEQKSDRERWGGGGGGGGERASVLSFGICIHEKKDKKIDPTLEKEKSFQFQTSLATNGKTGVPGGKPISRMQCKPSDINLDEGFTAIKAQDFFFFFFFFLREREMGGGGERHTHTYTLTQSYMRIHVLMQYCGRLQ